MISAPNPYKCLIIDDDPLITDLIKHFCSKLESIEYCISCNSAIDGLKLISAQDFDVLFLDYNMPELNGKAILELKQDDSRVIMITSHPDFAVDSYNYPQVIDYLLKPIKFERFVKSIEKLKELNHGEKPSGNKESYFIKDGGKWIKLKLSDVSFIKSDSNYVVWHTGDKNILELKKLKELQIELPANFKRVHRSYIINTNYIESITREQVNIKNQSIPVGNAYKEVIDEIITGQ